MTRDGVRWLNDQITTALREHPGATTAEVCRAFCPKCRETRPYHHYSRVYARLRALADQGVVVWDHWTESSPATTWRLQKAAADAYLDELEALWAAS